MRARISSFYLPLALVSLLLSAPEVRAEFKCSSDISYKWVKRPPVASHSPRTDAVAPGSRTPSPTATPVSPAPTPEPTTVRLLGIERGGNDEAIARAALQMETDRQRIRASEACKRDHESFGTCVALKMSARSNVLNSLSFSARSELERALTEECRQQEGSCLSVEVSEPKCREIVVAQPTASPAAEKPSDTKGSKEPAKNGKKK
jgi:hypothetical protein